jgi:hypothetical protein
MEICESCGTRFNVDKTRAKYNSVFGGDPDYDEYGSKYCASCAIEDTKDGLEEGKEILMLMGGED